MMFNRYCHLGHWGRSGSMHRQRRISFCSISELKARIVGKKDHMQGLSEVVACLSAMLAVAPSSPITGIVGPGVPVQGGFVAVPEQGWRNERSMVGIPFLSGRNPHCPEYPLMHEILMGIPSIGDSVQWVFRPVGIHDSGNSGYIFFRRVRMYISQSLKLFYVFLNINYKH